MRQRRAGRGNLVTVALAVAGLILAACGAAGCSSQAGTSRASVESCVQFGVAAIRHHVIVTALPPACQGLTAAQIDFAAGTALHSATAGVRGRALRRQRIGQASHYLAHMFVTVPAQRGEPRVAAPAAGWIGRTALGVTALSAWLITLGLGLAMMARWILRGRVRRAPGSRIGRPPALNFAHLGLATASLLIWIAYLGTGMTGLAWTATALLTLVTGLGMALLFLSASSRSRRQPVFAIGAHVIFATATILFAFLAAIG